MSNKLLSNTCQFLFLLLISAPGFAQVGIGTTTPKAYFNVADGKNVLFGPDVTGESRKFLWISSLGSLAAGFDAVASSSGCMALGIGAKATGLASVALGSNVSTNGKYGSFIIGDINGDVYSNTTSNQMMMRFSNGYKLYTNMGSQTYAMGVELAPGGNAWQTTSDSTRKENFRPANSAAFLDKISRMRLGSWNYKGQDAKQYRHYGPMAQDFFAAFGHDGVGTIGEDKSINQADFDGVNLIAIQALIQKVEKLEADNRQLRTELSASKETEKSTQARLDKLETLFTTHPTDTRLTFKP